MTATTQVLNGTFVLLLVRLFVRSAGIISMLVLARLLTTEDFGVVAVTTSVVFLFDILSESGSKLYLIQKQDVSTHDLDTSFTLNLILKGLTWTVFIIFVPFTASYFEYETLTLPLYTISLVILLGALHNPGMYMYEKELNYHPFMKLSIWEKIISFIVVLTLAFIYENYWAMIAGILTGSLVKVIGSYVLHEYRPKLSLALISQQWSFSKWILFKSVIGDVRAEFDTAMVTKLFGLSAVGGYNMMKNLSMMPAYDIVRPATQPLLSSFSKVKDDQPRLAYQVNISLIVICLITTPITSFIVFNEKLIIEVLLGRQWLDFSFVLKILAILLFTFSITTILHQALTSIGKVKWLFMNDLLSMIFIVTSLLYIGHDDLEDFTETRCVLGVISAIIFAMITVTYLRVSFHKLCIIMFEIGAISVFAGYLSTKLTSYLVFNQYALLLIIAVIYAFIYISCVIVALYFTRQSPELQHLTQLIFSFLTRVTGKPS